MVEKAEQSTLIPAVILQVLGKKFQDAGKMPALHSIPTLTGEFEAKGPNVDTSNATASLEP